MGTAIAFDRDGRILVHAQPDQRAARHRLTLGEEGDQATEASTLAEVGIGDHAMQQGKAKEPGFDGVGVAQRIRKRARTGDAAAVHRAIEILTEHRQARAGTTQRFARAHVVVECLGNGRSAPVTHIA